MHAPILGLIATLSAAVPAGLLRSVQSTEARWLSSTGATLSLIAASTSSAIWILNPPTARIDFQIFAFRVDPLAATLLPLIALALWTISAMIPRREVQGPQLADLHWLFASVELAVLADTPATLLCAELSALFASLNMLRRQRRNVLDPLVFSIAIAATFAALLFSHQQSALPLRAAAASLPSSALVFLAIASWLRLGFPPCSSWLSSLLEKQPMSSALPLALPLCGLVPIARLLGPALAENPLVASGATLFLVMALLSAALAAVQDRLSRSFAFTANSVIALVVVGLIDSNPVGFAGGELLWAGSLIALTGLGLAILAIKSRLGPIDLNRYYGLAQHAPRLALAYFAMSLANAGVPGSMEFAAADLLLHGSREARTLDLVLFAMTSAFIGANALRCTLHTFAGRSAASTLNLDLLPRERVAFAAMFSVLAIGGLAPNVIPLLRLR
jgi:NADH:ubiquinone oxidoreductase subunit 2 (subunit N)